MPALSPFPPETADSAEAAVLHQAGIPKQAADAAVQILPAAVRITAADAPHRLQPPIQTVDAIQRRDNMYLAATVDAAE